jgi:hypothetical protein
VSQRAPLSVLVPELSQGNSQPGNQAAYSNSKGKEVAEFVQANSLAGPEAESALAKVVKDANKITAECQHGMM